MAVITRCSYKRGGRKVGFHCTKDIQLFSDADEIRVWPSLVWNGVKELIRQHCVDLSWWISKKNGMNKQVKIKKDREKAESYRICNLTLGRTRKFIPPPWYEGGGGRVDGTLPQRFWYVAVFHFDMLQYFKTILHLVERLWSSQQDEVYFMGGGAAGGLWHRQQWSPSWPPFWIWSRIRNQIKAAINCNFRASQVKYHINKPFVSFHPQALLLLLKEVEKTCIFTQKWLDQLLLMTS